MGGLHGIGTGIDKILHIYGDIYRLCVFTPASKDIRANENGNRSFIAQWSPICDDQWIYFKFFTCHCRVLLFC